MSLYASVLGLFEKKNKNAIEHLNPARLDRPLLLELLGEHGYPEIASRLDRIYEGWEFLNDPADPGGRRDEFAKSESGSPADIEEIFTR